ncbi:MAG: hypothetical protein PVG79_06475 [Gemmatimonadales bacterium]|jgi:hypothetical protein
MKATLDRIRTGVLSAAISSGLLFGGAVTLSGTPDLTALENPPCLTTCETEWECDQWCDDHGYEEGYCYVALNCCDCMY